MPDKPSDEPERPPDEAWWERELHRNEKLMDKYMAVFDEEGEEAFEKYDTPDKLYNRVHYGIQPGEPLPPEALEKERERDPEFEEWKEQVIQEACEAQEAEAKAEKTEADGKEGKTSAEEDPFSDDDEDPFDNDPPDNEDYPAISKQARNFAVKAMKLVERTGMDSAFFLSAGKVGANLAGGHGLGYDDGSICGNIVKCRWALADCEVCRELLEPLVQRAGKPEYAQLLDECRQLSATIRDRIQRLRMRVWW